VKTFLPLLRNDWRLLLFGFVLMFCSSPGQTYFIALFGGQIRSDLGLSHGQFGAVYSIATLASAVVLLWSASLLDRINLRVFVLVVISGLAFAAFAMSLVQSVIALGLVIFLLRHLGQGLMSTTSSTSLMRYLSANRAKGNSVANMGYSAAEAILPSIIILALLTLSWRQAWQVTSVVLVVLIIPLVFYLLRELPNWNARFDQGLHQDRISSDQQGRAVGRKKHWTRQQVLRDPFFYLLVPALVSQSLLYTGFMFHQIHLVEEKAWSLTTWASLYALFSITTIVMSLLIGALADRVGAVRLAPFASVPMAFGLLALSSSSSALAATVFMFLMGCSTAAQGALGAPFFVERYGNKYFASIKSLASFIMVFATAISPVILGVFIDNGVSIDVLARSSAIYAFSVTTVAYVAYRRLILR
jgi:sugar phosphate permease